MTILRSKSSNHYCGPAALAALAGIHVDEAARMLREASGKRAVKGIAVRHVLRALTWQGLRASTLHSLGGPRPTLTQALRGVLKTRKPREKYLVMITGHFIAIQGRRLVDNKHPEGIALTACPYRRRRVKGVWRIEAGGEG